MTAPRRSPAPLVLLAAGLGTRFGGGVKPLAPVGPAGEPLLLVALDQARRAGFERAVVVTGTRSREPIERAVSRAPIPVAFADQGATGPPRATPWGTGAAVLAAAAQAGPGDVVVANGDDLYGTQALRAAHDWMATADGNDAAGGADALLVAYPVEATLSATGGVSRAVVTTGADGRLHGLREQRDVRCESGVVTTAEGLVLAPGTLVSMNLWAFRPRALELLRRAFAGFVARHAGDVSAEFGLPHAVGALLASDGLGVEVIASTSRWHGVTFDDDVARVRVELAEEGDG